MSSRCSSTSRPLSSKRVLSFHPGKRKSSTILSFKGFDGSQGFLEKVEALRDVLLQRVCLPGPAFPPETARPLPILGKTSPTVFSSFILGLVTVKKVGNPGHEADIDVARQAEIVLELNQDLIVLVSQGCVHFNVPFSWLLVDSREQENWTRPRVTCWEIDWRTLSSKAFRGGGSRSETSR